MTEVIRTLPQKITALYILIRVIPVLSWGISSSLMGLAFSYTISNRIRWWDYGLILLLIILVHGVVSHAFNDREDWLSGTDQLSPGVLSGGSGVIEKGQYSIEKISWMGKAALLLALSIGLYFLWRVGLSFLIILAVGVWSAIAYSCNPLKLAYHPFTGEWLCAFPAVFTCAIGTFYVLTGILRLEVVMAGVIQALLSMGLLMHHHISDISSDLQTVPPKITTVALVSSKWGIKKTPLVELVYFLMALGMAVAGSLFYHPVFWVTVPVALGCIGAALRTIPEDIGSITAGEYLLYWLIIGDAVIKTSILFLG